MKNTRNCEISSRIELFFKVTKTMFGLRDLHVYYRKYAITEIRMIFYTIQLFCQFCLRNGINIEKFVERVKWEESDLYYTLLETFDLFNELSEWLFNFNQIREKFF